MEKASTILLILILSVSTVPIIIKTPKVVANPGATLELVNPADGTHLFNFTTSQKAVNDTFLIDVIVNNAAPLFSWQIGVAWNTTLLNFSKIVKPSDMVFAGKTIVEALDTSTPGYVVYGQALINPADAVNVTRGKLCQIELKIIKGVSVLSPKVECNITFENIPIDTFLLNNQGLDIPIDYVINAHYIYQWVAPAWVSHTVIVDSQSFTVITRSNGEISPNNVTASIEEKSISFTVIGPSGQFGFVNVTIPKGLLDGNPSAWEVYVNNNPTPAQITSNATHTFVYVEFTFESPTTIKIKGTWIVPEFATAWVLLIPLSVTAFTVPLIKLTKRKK